MYKSRRKIFVFLLALVLILGVLPEFHVRAEDNSQTYKVGADDHTLWDRVQDGDYRGMLHRRLWKQEQRLP